MDEGRLKSGLPKSIETIRGLSARSKMGAAHARTVSELVNSGVPTSEVAKRYGVTRGAVTTALARWRRSGIL